MKQFKHVVYGAHSPVAATAEYNSPDDLVDVSDYTPSAVTLKRILTGTAVYSGPRDIDELSVDEIIIEKLPDADSHLYPVVEPPAPVAEPPAPVAEPPAPVAAGGEK